MTAREDERGKGLLFFSWLRAVSDPREHNVLESAQKRGTTSRSVWAEPLWKYGARAASRQAVDSAVRANARTAWDEFFKQRKDADADLPILQRSENGVCPLAPIMPVGK